MRPRLFRDSTSGPGRLNDLLTATGALIDSLDGETLSRQVHLARIAAPTGGEKTRGVAVAKALAEYAGTDCVVDNTGNVIARLSAHPGSSTEAPVVCLAHLDTVFDFDTPLEARYEDERIYCPGIGDNSRGLSAMITLARLFRAGESVAATMRRPVEFVATVGEEGLGNLRGAHAYFADRMALNKPTPHAVLVLDGPGDENIVHHALGSRRYRVTFRGAGGHSWVDIGTPNAVHAAARAAAWLADVPRAMHARASLTVSGIHGGESMNSIPAHASLDVDVRATDQQLLMRIDAELRTIVDAAVSAEIRGAAAVSFASAASPNAARASMHTDIVLLGERPCGSLPHEHALVQIAQDASHYYGVDPVSAIASTDANVPLSLGIPAITIGAGGTGGGAHTVNEWYSNANGSRGVARAFAILAALAA